MRLVYLVDDLSRESNREIKGGYFWKKMKVKHALQRGQDMSIFEIYHGTFGIQSQISSYESIN